MNTKNGCTILVGEDELEVREYLDMALKCLGCSVELAQDGDEVVASLQSSRTEFTAVLLDLMMPNQDGMATLREIRRIDPDLPVIIVSGASSPVNIVTAMKNGGTDFLCKPVDHEDLSKAIGRALESKGKESLPPLRKAAAAAKSFLGRNPRMKEIHALVSEVAWSEAPVVVQGETGAGKEVIARQLHAQSPRAGKPFLKLNCAALPSELVESELFGYERGAFTGAFQKKAGMFELADGGTILLDEIGDMDIRLQAKLLQVLQDHEFHRIGGKEPTRVDVRVIAATHRDLEKAIVERAFRQDLYYRLNVINIVLPPLRECPEDIVPLAEFLIKRHTPAGSPSPVISPALRDAMLVYQWPGNVRELENFVRKFLILRNADSLALELQIKARKEAAAAASTSAAPLLGVMPPVVSSLTVAPKPAGIQENTAIPILEQVTQAKRQAEIDAIVVALNATRWNRKQASELLKIDYKILLYRMKRLGIEKPKPAKAEYVEAAPKMLVAAGD